ncbi:mandelate racemase/muconate lactonizing enzyme family protein [Cognatishimia maritima]|uniref:L-alanine-DL-glutamate epimerase n=1 Tax=Cognatishimia maritima TaxID=870908 RepID=A0A1M5QWB2_9RHOB|nr:mandelate racemase/muconate lactonizing enzyme family protein [Cognatishimia maritima]SHH18258.1 L-alanine-DL-glutamate epimerase [Cognatishimia maritima]
MTVGTMHHLDIPAIVTPVEIAKIDVWAFREPTKVAVETSFGRMSDRRAVVLRVEDRDGCFGFGEIFANWPVAAPEHRVRLLVEDICWLLEGQRLTRPAQLFDYLTDRVRLVALQAGEFGPFQQVIAGLDTAIWDLFARKSCRPLAQYLNKVAANEVPAYASGIHFNVRHQAVAQAQAVGFDRFKIKVGFHKDATVEAQEILNLLESLSDDQTLLVDANQAWTAAQAETFLRATNGAGLGWVEEPIPADADETAWRSCAEATTTPLAGGENIAGYTDFDAALSGRFLSVLQPDVAKWGGVTGCTFVATEARKHGKTYCPHFLGGGIGLLASAHLLAAHPGGQLEMDVNESALRTAFGDAFLPKVTAGQWTLSTEHGLGVTRLPEALNQYLVVHQEIAL